MPCTVRHWSHLFWHLAARARDTQQPTVVVLGGDTTYVLYCSTEYNYTGELSTMYSDSPTPEYTPSLHSSNWCTDVLLYL
jgi:hypothetical protein